MNRRLGLLVLLVSLVSILVVVLPPAEATTVVPPPNLGQLARASQSVTFARAVESWVEDGESIPYTVTRFHRLETVAGARTGDVFEVREPGGRLPRRAAAVAGAPRYQAGQDYLLFLDRAPDHRWRSKTMAYGLLQAVPGKDLLRPLPEAAAIEVRPPAKNATGAVEPVGTYRRSALLQHLREVARGAPWDGKRVAAEPLLALAAGEKLQASPASCVFLLNNADGLPTRWFGFETGGTTVSIAATTPGQNGIADGGVSAVQEGIAAWTDHPDSVIRLAFGGTMPRSVSCSANFDVQRGAVLFNDPCNDLADLSSCSGMLSFGGAIYDPDTTQTHDGDLWHPIFSTFVIVNNGTECIGETSFKETVTHELGHTVGFGHHEPPDPADALMSALLKKDGRGASIAVVDKRCAAYDYHTFLDVPFNFWTWRWIEAVDNAGAMSGCGNGNFCPTDAVTRGSMATFLLKAKEGGAYVPPACTTATFSDVPCSDPLAPWVEELVRRGVTAGCGNGKYCPADPVTRNQMAVFLIKTFEGASYVPPACAAPPFSDVPCSSSFAPWVREITQRGITAGCGAGNYCPANVVSRAQMSVFVSTTFSLPLPPAP